MEAHQQEKQTLKQCFLAPFPISNWYDSLFHVNLPPVQTLRQYTNFQSFSTDKYDSNCPRRSQISHISALNSTQAPSSSAEA